MKYLPRVLGYLKPHWKLAVISVVLMFLGGLVGLLLPWPLKFLVDNVLQDHPMSSGMAQWLGPTAENRPALLVLTVVAGFLLAFAQNGLNVLDNYVNTK